MVRCRRVRRRLVRRRRVLPCREVRRCCCCYQRICCCCLTELLLTLFVLLSLHRLYCDFHCSNVSLWRRRGGREVKHHRVVSYAFHRPTSSTEAGRQKNAVPTASPAVSYKTGSGIIPPPALRRLEAPLNRGYKILYMHWKVKCQRDDGPFPSQE